MAVRGRRPGKPGTLAHPVEAADAKAAIDRIIDRRRAAGDPSEVRLSRDLDDAAQTVRFVIAESHRLNEEDLYDAGVIDGYLAWRRFIEERRAAERRLALAEAVRHKKSVGTGHIDLTSFAYRSYGLSNQAFNSRLAAAARLLRRETERPNEFNAAHQCAPPPSAGTAAAPAPRRTRQAPGRDELIGIVRDLVARRAELRCSEADAVGEMVALFEVATEDPEDRAAIDELAMHLKYLLASVDIDPDTGAVTPVLTSENSEVAAMLAAAKRALGLTSSSTK